MSEEKRTYKVVVTGFGPFQNVPFNESWAAVSGLWEESFPAQVKLITRELPVVYDVVKNEVSKLWEEHSPDLIIHVGVHKKGDKIYLEKRTFNLDYTLTDISDNCPKDSCCVAEGPDTLETKLDVEKLCEFSNNTFSQLKSSSVCGQSLDPGRYLCAYTYYLSLHRDASKALFVHVPDSSLFPVKDMTIALKSIIIDSLRQLYNLNY